MTTFRRAWMMQLLDGAEADYDAAHAAIWPDLARQMIADGISRFHLFRSGLTVFAMQERRTPFPDRDLPPSELSLRWWREMARLMVTEPDGRPRRTDLVEIFDLQHATTSLEATR